MISPFESTEYFLDTYYVDTQKRMTAVTLCNFLQTLAGNAAEKRGYGYTFMHNHSLVWVLIRIKARIHKYPLWNDKVKLETWVRGIDRIKSDRHFILSDRNGDEAACAITEWAMIDFKSRRPQYIENFLDKSKTLDPKSVNISPPNKIKELINPVICGMRSITYSDIDLNQHVSNVKYLEWFLDTYDIEFHNNNTIKEFEINFLSECKYGQKINIFKEYETDKIHYGSLIRSDDNKEVLRIKIEWN